MNGMEPEEGQVSEQEKAVCHTKGKAQLFMG